MSHGGAREGSGRKKKFGEIQKDWVVPRAVPSDVPVSHLDMFCEKYLQAAKEDRLDEFLQKVKAG